MKFTNLSVKGNEFSPSERNLRKNKNITKLDLKNKIPVTNRNVSQTKSQIETPKNKTSSTPQQINDVMNVKNLIS